ncbi:hypothetical protein TSUD_147880 [Trifolium subterraneum]|uniref:Uncharacterized protein n=1 Tax=Trifolium subterraneum TaxID=3900 RepID=A0A2Z6N5M9_TRISU|nr:hypothetical protein TSUD_147880 [Trifolium subterraneum]
MESLTYVLESLVIKTIKALKRLLRYDIDMLLDQVDDFSAIVEDHRLASWSMRLHEELHNLAFIEEEAVTHRMKVLEDELKVLSKKKEELHLSNKDEIAILLAKRRNLARLEVKTKDLGEGLKKIIEDLVTTKKYKRALEDMQTMALDAAPDV